MFYLKFTISSVLVTARAGWNCSIVASGKCSMGAPKIVRVYVTCKCVFLSGGTQGMTQCLSTQQKNLNLAFFGQCIRTYDYMNNEKDISYIYCICVVSVSFTPKLVDI